MKEDQNAVNNPTRVKATAENLKEIKLSHQALKELTPDKRVDSLENMLKNKLDKDPRLKCCYMCRLNTRKRK